MVYQKTKKKSIFVCEQCYSRNYTYHLSLKRETMLILKKYCPFCKVTTNHNESK